MKPSEFYHKISEKLYKREYLICFVSVFVFGMAAHAYKFLNILPNYDSLGSFYDPQNTIQLGRCFLTLGCGISSYYDLTWIIALLSLIYITVSAICVVEIFGIKSPAAIILSAGILVTFPTVTCTFAFMYTADGYFLAMMLSSLAVLTALRRKKGFIPAAVMFCFSLGMYQAYILYAMALTLIYAVKRLLIDNDSVKSLFARLLHVLYAGAAGALLYFISYKTLLRLEGRALSSYNGLSDISLRNLPSVGGALYNCLHDFVFFFFYSEKGASLYVILNVLMAALLFLLVFCLILKKRRALGTGRILLSFAAACLLPFCTYIYYFVSDVDYHTLMLEGLAFVYILVIVFYDHDGIFPAMGKWFQWGIVILMSLIIYNFILTANITYTNMHNSYERSLAVVNRMADRMEQLPEYSAASKIAVIGKLPGSDETVHNFPPDMVGTVPNYIMRLQPHYTAMLDYYNGIVLKDVSEEELQSVLDSAEYAQMRDWPDASSVKIIGDTVVIRLSEPYVSK